MAAVGGCCHPIEQACHRLLLLLLVRRHGEPIPGLAVPILLDKVRRSGPIPSRTLIAALVAPGGMAMHGLRVGNPEIQRARRG